MFITLLIFPHAPKRPRRPGSSPRRCRTNHETPHVLAVKLIALHPSSVFHSADAFTSGVLASICALRRPHIGMTGCRRAAPAHAEQPELMRLHAWPTDSSLAPQTGGEGRGARDPLRPAQPPGGRLWKHLSDPPPPPSGPAAA